MVIIDNNSINPSGPSSARSRAGASVSPASGKGQPVSTDAAVSNSKDNVVLSQEAQSLSRLQAKINNSPDVNLDRVAAIKQAIAEGRFEINPERIAENMLNQDDLFN